MAKVLVLFAHPAFEKSLIHQHLLSAIANIKHLTLHDLYEKYPDFFIDVQAEQRLLLEHEVILFQFPFYWYSTPALLKEWQDLVLEWGFAYGEGGNKLQGKGFQLCLSTGGAEAAYDRSGYNYFSIQELMSPLLQTARLCQMRVLPPFLVQGVHALKKSPQPQLNQRLAQDTAAYRDLLTRLTATPLDELETMRFD